MEVNLWIKLRDVKPATDRGFLPLLGINFYDKVRRPAGNVVVGPWQGTSDWREVTQQIMVPKNANEAVVRIGLMGSVGEISFDAIRIKPLLRKRAK